MTKLLLNESPLVIIPSLANAVGLNESIVLQQLHFWVEKSTNIYDGHKWVYNTYDDWQEQFPFWSIRTIKRIITGLENNGYLITSNYNKLKIDRTKWYRINYEKLESLVARPRGQVGTMDVPTCHDGGANLAPPLPEITTEITTEIKREEEENARVNQLKVNNPFLFFEENGFGAISGYMSQKIKAWCEDLSDELVVEAMKLAVEKGAKHWSYVEAILRDWVDKNIQTVEEVHAALIKHREEQKKKQVQRRPKQSIRQEQIPEWLNNQSHSNEIPLDNAFEEEKRRLQEELQQYQKKNE